jgi:hypothetical protein
MRRILFFLFIIFLLSSCGGEVRTPEATAEPTSATVELGAVIYTDPSQPVEPRVEDLLKRMSLDEKIGQMTQVEKNSIRLGDITRYFIGSVLSGGILQTIWIRFRACSAINRSWNTNLKLLS